MKPQILLRIDDKNGHHIIKKDGEQFTIEGHRQRPEDKNVTPEYFFPIPEQSVAEEFKAQGKEWRFD